MGLKEDNVVKGVVFQGRISPGKEIIPEQFDKSWERDLNRSHGEPSGEQGGGRGESEDPAWEVGVKLRLKTRARAAPGCHSSPRILSLAAAN